MKTKTFIIYLAVMLVAVFLSSRLSMNWQAKKNKKELERKPHVEMMNYIYDELDLADSQKTDFNRYTGIYHRMSRQTEEEIGKLNRRILEELASAQPNPTALQKLAEDAGELYTLQKMHTINYHFNLEELLDKEQIGKMQEIYRVVLESYRHRGKGAKRK